MCVELCWLASRSASALYAVAAVIGRHRPADGAFAEALAPAEATLIEVCHRVGINPRSLLDHLVPLAAEIEDPTQLAELGLTKVMSSGRTEHLAPPLSDVLRQLDPAIARCRPRLAEELELRSPILREQWEARGPGLMAALGRLTDPAVVAARADVVLVHPILGGGGEAYPMYNRVALEAVLANPHADLPEVVRLGWLLSQLNLKLPAPDESIEPHRLPRVIRLAMLCAVLAAAEEVELVQPDTRSRSHFLARVIDCWRIDGATAAAATATSAMATDVWQWWQEYRAARPRWPAALAKLDRLLR